MRERLSFTVSLLLIAFAGFCGSAAGATNPTPFLSLPLIPASAAPGGEGFTLTVNGTGFVSGAVVNWNGSPRSTTFISQSRLAASITEADIATAETATITVTNPPPGGGSSNAVYFSVTKATDTVAFKDSVLQTLGNASEVVVGDFNGDGKPDIVVMETVPIDFVPHLHTVIEILLGNGDGTFQQPVQIVSSPSGTYGFGLAAGDFNADGKLDLVGSYTDNFASQGLFALLGKGDGTFQPLITSDYNRPENSFDGTATMQVTDVNGDGILDLVRACRSGLCVELGNGDGTFRPQFTFPPNVPLGDGVYRPQGITLGDFQTTGKLDVAAGGNFGLSNYQIDVLQGKGDGTFRSPSNIYMPPGPLSFLTLESLATADFDGDGILDLAFLAIDSNPSPTDPPQARVLNIMHGNGDGTFQPPFSVGGLFNTLQNSVLIPGDFNGDGHLDIATKNVVMLIKNAAPGNVDYSLVSLPTSHTVMAAGDFTGTGRLDLVSSDFIGQLHLLAQIDPGDFQINPESTTRRVEGGERARFEIGISAINDFKGTVSLTVSGLPTGATAFFTPSTIEGSGTTRLIVHTHERTPIGSYPLVITGTSASRIHTSAITLNVGPKEDFTDFTLSVQQSFQTITPGAVTTFDISTASLNGFKGDLLLSLSGLPDGSVASFSASEIHDGSGASVLTVTTAPGTPTATYPLTITATSEGHSHVLTHNTVVNLNVGPAGTDFTDFTFSISPLAQTVKAGTAAIFTITTATINGPSTVAVEFVEPPPVASVSFYPQGGVLFRGSGTILLGFLTSPLTPPGTYSFPIDLFGRVAHGTQITLTVTP